MVAQPARKSYFSSFSSDMLLMMKASAARPAKTHSAKQEGCVTVGALTPAA
jgi:hypothetical protein